MDQIPAVTFIAQAVIAQAGLPARELAHVLNSLVRASSGRSAPSLRPRSRAPAAARPRRARQSSTSSPPTAPPQSAARAASKRSSAERCLLSSLSSDAIHWKGRPNFRHHLQLANPCAELANLRAELANPRAELVDGLLRVLEEFPQDDDHWVLLLRRWSPSSRWPGCCSRRPSARAYPVGSSSQALELERNAAVVEALDGFDVAQRGAPPEQTIIVCVRARMEHGRPTRPALRCHDAADCPCAHEPPCSCPALPASEVDADPRRSDRAGGPDGVEPPERLNQALAKGV